jgi:serine/threonine-protein kinase
LPATATLGPDAPRDALPPAPPGYELVRRLGGGGMGDVFLAWDVAGERQVAMKFLRAPGSPIAVDRFLVEVRALAKFDHPNIVRVLAHDFYRATPFFTMEYAPGGSLSDRVFRSGPLDPVEAARLIATAARAVQVAHEADVVHRDIKPSNILLGADGSPKVSDFGLAKRTDRDDGLTTLSGPLGTPAYMPPEQVAGKYGEVGRGSDVYGLGATLYHLVTGRPPFTGPDAEVLHAVVHHPPKRPRAIRSAVPLELEGIVLKCLEKNPADRYATAAELADDLDRFLAGVQPRAPRMTRLRRVRRWAARNRLMLVVACLTVAAFGAAVVALLPPEDPLKAMQRELAAGGEVVLVPERGKPRWYRWALGSPALGVSSSGDGSCSFEAIDRSMLELCPDPMWERYRIRARIRFVASKATDAGKVDGPVGAGVYFAHTTTPGKPGSLALTQFQVFFNDYRQPPKEPVPKGKKTGGPELLRFIYFQDPGGTAEFDRPTVRYSQSPPAGTVPGPWRLIVIDVTPERVQVWWGEPGPENSPFADLTGEQMRELYRGLEANLTRKAPDHGVTLPPWSPRAAIGIWNDRAAIDFKSVTITPNP